MTELPQHGKHQHKKYFMTCDEYDDLWSRGGGRCEICDVLWSKTPHGMLHIDHDRLRGNWGVRGLLCSRCNTQLGTPGRLTGPEVDRYLAMPWRTEIPAHLVKKDSAERRAFFDFMETYGRVRKKVERTRTRLQEHILRERHKRTARELAKATGITEASIKRLFVAEDEWLAGRGHIRRPADRPIIRLEGEKRV